MLFSHPPIRLAWTSAFQSARKLPLPRSRLFSSSAPRFIINMETVDTSERLTRLRQLMQERKVDVYSMASPNPVHCCCLLEILYSLNSKLFPRKIVISPNTLLHVTAVEVRISPSALFQIRIVFAFAPCLPRHVTYALLSSDRIYLGLLRIGRNCHHFHDQGGTIDRWPLLQPGFEAA